MTDFHESSSSVAPEMKEPKVPESKSENPLAMWDARITAGELTPEDIISDLNKVAKQWVFQKEKGDSGYVHYQIRLSLIKKRRHGQRLIVLGLLQHKWEYFQPTTNPAFYKGELFYAMKEDTRILGPWTDKDKKKEQYIPRQYRGCETTLMPWQQQVWEHLPDFQRREINLIYDKTGNNGKSTLAHLCRIHKNALIIPSVNDAEKIIAATCCLLRAKELRNPTALFFDMPRALGKDRLFGFYTAIEQIKSGYVYDFRNSYKDWDFDTPQIWVFTNHLPEPDLLSRDRWHIYEIKNNHLVNYEAPPEEKKKPIVDMRVYTQDEVVTFRPRRAEA